MKYKNSWHIYKQGKVNLGACGSWETISVKTVILSVWYLRKRLLGICWQELKKLKEQGCYCKWIWTLPTSDTVVFFNGQILFNENWEYPYKIQQQSVAPRRPTWFNWFLVCRGSFQSLDQYGGHPLLHPNFLPKHSVIIEKNYSLPVVGPGKRNY